MALDLDRIRAIKISIPEHDDMKRRLRDAMVERFKGEGLDSFERFLFPRLLQVAGRKVDPYELSVAITLAFGCYASAFSGDGEPQPGAYATIVRSAPAIIESLIDDPEIQQTMLDIWEDCHQSAG